MNNKKVDAMQTEINVVQCTYIYTESFQLFSITVRRDHFYFRRWNISTVPS